VRNTFKKAGKELEIIDIYHKPSLAVTEEIIAIPSPDKFPLPEGRVIGDLSMLKGFSKDHVFN
jgi:hypothetical protein